MNSYRDIAARQPIEALRQLTMTRGDCIGATDPDAWFPREPPHGVESSKAVQESREVYEATARQLCGGCPVRAECLELALREEAGLPRTWLHGIRGGTAPWTRENIIRSRKRRAAREAARAVA